MTRNARKDQTEDHMKKNFARGFVLCCAAAAPAIEAALCRALTPEFSAVAHAAQSPYNGGDTSGKICRVLAQFDFAKPKTFYDGPVPEFNPKRSISL